jgi:hypothetical protein
MGIPSIGPSIDLSILGCTIAFRQHRCERGQVSLNLQKIRIRDLFPFCFERSLELSPKRFELLLIHLTLLYDMVDEQVVPITTALGRESGREPQKLQPPMGTLA